MFQNNGANGRSSRREFLFANLIGATVSAAPAAKLPNIIMILCDDLGYADLGCYGHRVIQTPNIDRLAATGTKFTQFYTPSPVCSPSRTALMTGGYPARYGIHHAAGAETGPRIWLPASATIIPQVLQRAGYYTAHIGKWHLGDPPEAPMPTRRGFDHFFGCLGGRPSSPWMKYARSMDPEMILNENRPVVYKGHITDIETAAAIDVISERRNKPFFLNLWYNAPHEPLSPLPYQEKRYQWWSPEEQTYFQTVTDLDTGVGRIVAKLDELGIRKDTMIVFSSDNGPEAHNRINRYSRGWAWPLKGMKTQLWEGGVREPAILSWPGHVPAGKTSTAITSMLDLFPTFCQAAETAAPQGHVLDGGVDLVAVANGKRSTAQRPLFFEYHYGQRGVAPSLPMALRLGKWKLFTNHQFDTVQLYNLDQDVGEQTDLAREHPLVVRDLKKLAQKWWAQFADHVDLHEQHTHIPVPAPEELDKRFYKN